MRGTGAGQLTPRQRAALVLTEALGAPVGDRRLSASRRRPCEALTRKREPRAEEPWRQPMPDARHSSSA
jgi:hypothetical protein